MGTQSVDDPGRELDPPWLGPKGLRWPFDWPVRRWIFFALVVAVLGILLAFVAPFGLVLALAACGGGRSAGRLIDPARPRRWQWTVVGASTVFVLLVLPVRALLFPMPFLLVPFVAVGTGLYLTRLYGRLLDWNRPIGYYARIPRLVAAGPRLAPEREVNPAALILTAGPDADRRDVEPVHKVTSDAFEVQDARHKIQNALERKTRRRLGSPHYWTGPGETIEPGKFIHTHDRLETPPDPHWVETSSQDALTAFVEKLRPADATRPEMGGPTPDPSFVLMADPARPRKPRWIRTVPGGIQVGNTILDFTRRLP